MNCIKEKEQKVELTNINSKFMKKIVSQGIARKTDLPYSEIEEVKARLAELYLV